MMARGSGSTRLGLGQASPEDQLKTAPVTSQHTTTTPQHAIALLRLGQPWPADSLKTVTDCATVICHTRELAYQIKYEFDRFAKYFQDVKTAVVYGGMPIAKDRDMLRDDCPHILIGTPGRVLGLLREKDLKLDKLTQFVLDECDKCLDKLGMRKDVQQIFIETPKKKQVMMFSATMISESRGICKKFMQDPHELPL